jgi:hypothetical protein
MHISKHDTEEGMEIRNFGSRRELHLTLGEPGTRSSPRFSPGAVTDRMRGERATAKSRLDSAAPEAGSIEAKPSKALGGAQTHRLILATTSAEHSVDQARIRFGNSSSSSSEVVPDIVVPNLHESVEKPANREASSGQDDTARSPGRSEGMNARSDSESADPPNATSNAATSNTVIQKPVPRRLPAGRALRRTSPRILPKNLRPSGLAKKEWKEAQDRDILLSLSDTDKMKGLVQGFRKLHVGDIERLDTFLLEPKKELLDACTLASDYASDHTDAVVNQVCRWLQDHQKATDEQIFEQVMQALMGGTERTEIRAVVADLPENFCKLAAIPHLALNKKLGLKYDDSELIDRTWWTDVEKQKAAYKKTAIGRINGSIIGGPLCPAVRRGLAWHKRGFEVMNAVRSTTIGMAPGLDSAKVSEKTRRKWDGAFKTFASMVVERGQACWKD